MVMAFLVAIWLVGSQNPMRPVEQVYARVAGRVIAADSGRPVARAAVTITRVNERSPMQVTATDEEGRFVLDDVLPGTYSLAAARPGLYTETAYGQTTPDAPPRLLTVKAGADTQVEIALVPGAVVAGRIFDPSGGPMALAEVSLSPADPEPHAVLSTLRGLTNDRGEYRLFGLRAGEYVLSATVPRVRSDRRQFAPIYFPGVTDIVAATRIQLAPGQEIANADFTLRLISTVKVSGVAVGPDGQPLPGGSLALYLAGADGRLVPRNLLTRALSAFDGLSGVGSIKGDGTFSIDGVPGHYLLRGRYESRGVPEHAIRYSTALMISQPLFVDASDVTNLLLKFSTGAALKGKFVFEGPRPARPQVFRVTIETGEPGAFAGAAAAEDGTITVGGIESGNRRVHAIGPRDWVLKGIYVNGRDVADRTIEFGDDTVISDVSVVFTAVKTPLTVTLDGNKPDTLVTVTVFPEDSSLWHAESRRTLSLVATPGGVVFDQLPPGDYLVAAINDLSPDTLKGGDTKMLEALRGISQKVQLTEGVPVTVRLRTLPFPK